MPPRSRLEAYAPVVAGLLLCLPVLVAYYPPMTDLPFHEATVSLLRHLGDPSLVPPGLYVRNLGHPNQLFYVCGWFLSYVVSPRWAVKLLVAAAVAAVPICGARFARSVGASPLAALVVAPMALGWLFSWGLVTNIVGLAALLAVLPAIDRHAESPTPASTLRAIGCVLLLYFAHEAMMFALAGAILLLAVVHPFSRKTPLRLAPFAFAAVVTVAQAQWQKQFMSKVSDAMMRTVWDSLGNKLSHVPYMLLPATDGAVLFSMCGLCLAAVVSFFVLRRRERAAAPAVELPPAGLARAQAWGHRYRWEIFAAAGFLAYLAFPLTLNSAILVYQRWFHPAFAVLALVAAPRDLGTGAARVPRIVVFVLPVATLLVAWPAFADSSRSYRAFDEIAAHIEPASATVVLNLGPGDDTRTFSLRNAGGRILATRGGRLGYSFTDSPISPVIIPPEYRWVESMLRVTADGWALQPARDLRMYRYVIVRTTDVRIAKLVGLALRPEARFVTTAGEWVLFESTLATEPARSPELPPGNPPPPSLQDRLSALRSGRAR